MDKERREVKVAADIIGTVLGSIGSLLVYIGVFVLLVNIGAAIKAIGEKS